MKQKLFTLLLAVAASVGTVFAENGTCGYNLTWNLTDSVLTISGTGAMTDYSSSSSSRAQWYSNRSSIKSVVIEDGVTNIGDFAFYDCRGLTSVTIPNSVTSIGGYAFFSCTSLTSVTIGNSVTSIGDQAFRGCTGLTSVTIPEGVTSIGDAAFCDCSGLTSINVADDNPNYISKDGVLFDKQQTTLIQYPGGKQGAYVIPNSVTSIGNYAFYGCSGLTSVTIPNSVTSIGMGAFMNCTALTSVTIPDSVTSIGREAFYGCTDLTSVSIPNSVTSIEQNAFSGCSGLTSVTIPNSVTSIGYSAFYYCTGLTSLKLSAMLEEPDRNSDYTLIAGCYRQGGSRDSYQSPYEWLKNLISIEAPAWFFDVPETDWIYCPRHLQHVAVNNGELTDNVLAVINRSYKTLQTLDVSNVTNTEFADEAFKGYYNLTELKLPAGLQKVGYMMVAGCKNLQSIDIPASVEEIEQSAFEDCRSIKTITFGGAPAGAPGRFNAPAASTSQLHRIGNWAFYNAHELQNLEIPEGVTEIGDGAFYGCTYLEDLVLPSSVQSIGDNTFALCSKLNKIVVNAVTPPSVQAKTFYDVKRQIPVYVPDECVDAYKNDAYWQEFDIQGRSNMPQGLDEISSSLQGGDRGRLIYHEGQIYILRGEKIYTVTGQEVK